MCHTWRSQGWGRERPAHDGMKVYSFLKGGGCERIWDTPNLTSLPYILVEETASCAQLFTSHLASPSQLVETPSFQWLISVSHIFQLHECESHVPESDSLFPLLLLLGLSHHKLLLGFQQ